jgi:hypothetical protein
MLGPEGGTLLRIINYLCYTCTLISIPLTIYLYFQTLQERAPAYYVSPERTRIIDTTVPAPTELQVLYKGKDLRANVSALIVYFWNDGKAPIKAEDVLEPLRIEIDQACEILDVRLLKVSRPLTRFAKGDVSETRKNSLPISFSILEHGDGAAIQIIYTGNPDAGVKMLGVVVGAGQVRAIASARRQKVSNTAVHKIAYYALIFVIAATIALAAYRLAKRRGRNQGWEMRDLIYVAVIALYLGMGAGLSYDMYHRFEPVVPRTIWTEQ